MHWLIATVLVAAGSALGQPLEIENQYGGVAVEVVTEPHIRAWRVGATEQAASGIATSRSRARVLIEALPPEGESPDIALQIPLGVPFSVRTEAGDVSIAGMVRRVLVESASGSLAIQVPLEITQVVVDATSRPKKFVPPSSRRMQLLPVSIRPRFRIWRAEHHLRSRDLAFGRLDAQLHHPPRIEIGDWQIPDDWPLKPHAHSKAAIDRLLARAERRANDRQTPPPKAPATPPPLDEAEFDGETAIFTSDVRMVSLSVAVSDNSGRPLTGLGPEQFVVEEDGTRQEIRVATAEESPFNMGILLDLSGSTSVDLEHMQAATLRLIELAGPSDRVALYAMAGSMFHRLVGLTSDSELLAKRARVLPYPVGGSPLWDTIALAYDDEFPEHTGERNVLIVISDGIDNRISGQSVPSMLRASRLIQAAEEMDLRIYPIFLLSGQRFGRSWSARAQNRMESLASKTGGKLFTARSIADVDPVLPELAREMRSVYGIAYYPVNQDFDGRWRRVKVKVATPGARVRARPGYFAD